LLKDDFKNGREFIPGFIDFEGFGYPEILVVGLVDVVVLSKFNPKHYF
jgi:hypothetical protein